MVLHPFKDGSVNVPTKRAQIKNNLFNFYFMSLILKSIRLSANAKARVVDATNGINGKLNETSDGRKYYMTEWADGSNPFAPTRQRMIAQQVNSNGEAVWTAGSPDDVKRFIGKSVDGVKMVTKTVAPYQVGDRTVTTYTAIVFPHENVETVFRNAGHAIMEAAPTVIAAAVSTAVESEVF
jgi:hypothetical protein